ncbi:ATP-dependent DNA helicase Q4-like, partial [Patiria miniata]|uniref:CCHC-type domain-containing protein n=1 Tax=Patiria miniata TaxID=46514 RepID=A0A914AZ07_PATMI
MDVSSRAVELKKTLKKWEKAFHDTHDRKASRLDIKEAPQRVQDAYREYNDLKKTGDGSSVPTVTEDKTEKISSGTWGAHLNQSNKSTADKQSEAGSKHEQGNILRQYSRKLQHSTSASKLPKTPSYRRAGSGSDASKTSPKDAFQASIPDDDPSSKEDVITQKSTGSIFSCLRDTKIAVTSSCKKAKLRRDDVAVGMLRAKPPKKQSLKTEWLDNCEQDLLVGVKGLPAQDSESTPHRGTVGNHAKTNQENQENIWDGESSKKPGHKLDDASKPTPSSSLLTSDYSVAHGANRGNSFSIKSSSESEKLHTPKNSGSRSKTASVAGVKMDVNDDLGTKQSFRSRADCEIPERSDPDNSVMRECKASPGEVAMEIRERTVSNGSIKATGSPKTSISPLSNVPNMKRSESPSVRTPRQISDNPATKLMTHGRDIVTKAQHEDSHHKESSFREDDDDSNLCRKPKPGIIGNLQEVSELDALRNEEDTMKKEQGEYTGVDGATLEKKSVRSKKIASSTSRTSSSSATAPARSNLNENFVKLEMKKKRYTRKGLFHMKGEAYKRQVWKQKMAGGGGLGLSGRGGWRGGGRGGRGRGRGGFNMANPTDKCFKCGQTGHWASRCMGFQPGAGDDKKAEIKEEDFPTLEEAAMAARGIKSTPDGEKDAGSVDVVPDANVETVFDFPPPPPPIEPLLQLNSDGKPGEAPSCVYKALKQMGYSSFRPGQEQAVMRILSGLSTLVVLSTGAGKSLVYQLASLMYSQRAPCITLVISPLVSLMDDQVGGLPDCLRGGR